MSGGGGGSWRGVSCPGGTRSSNNIVIATAQHERAMRDLTHRRFLQEVGIRENDPIYARTDQSIFDRNGSMKKPMLEHIFKLKRKEIPGLQPKDIIFFDDRPENILVAKELGISTQLVNSTGHGLTLDEYNSAMNKVNWSPKVCIFDIDATLTDETTIGKIKPTFQRKPYKKYNLTPLPVIEEYEEYEETCCGKDTKLSIKILYIVFILTVTTIILIKIKKK